jgi:hypothetical protein
LDIFYEDNTDRKSELEVVLLDDFFDFFVEEDDCLDSD